MTSFIFSVFLACGDTTNDTAEIPIEISNAGPEGSSHMENSCGPTDGGALTLTVGIIESDECLGAVDPDFSVVLQIWNSTIESGVTLPILSDQAFFYHAQTVQSAIDGEVDFNFEGDWQDGIEFSGFYWIELEDGVIIQGGFEGVHCGGEIFCG